MPYICNCGQKFDLVAALNAIPPERMGGSGMFVPTCSGCGEKMMEVRLRNGGYDVGYTYFGGSMHFETVQRVSAKGLKTSRSDPDDLDITIDGRHWHFGIRHISSFRFCVLPRAFAIGKRIDELDVNQWEVSLIGMERNGIPFEYSGETVVESDDFLWLSGPSPCLTRAWHYMNDGN